MCVCVLPTLPVHPRDVSFFRFFEYTTQQQQPACGRFFLSSNRKTDVVELLALHTYVNKEIECNVGSLKGSASLLFTHRNENYN